MSVFDKKEHAQIICFFLLIICAAFSLSYPLAFRSALGEQLFVGEQSYETLLATHRSFSFAHPLPYNDYILSQTPQPIPFSFSNYLYDSILFFVPIWFLPALISLLLLTVFWFTLKKFSIPLSTRFIASCMFAFSPLFVSTQLTLGPAAFLTIFLLLIILALRSHVNSYICAFLAFLTALFGIDALLPLLIIILFTVPTAGHAPIFQQKKSLITGATLGFLTWLILSIFTKTSFTYLLSLDLINNLFVDFGATSGQTLLLTILALIGLVNVWKTEFRWHFVAALLLVIWSSVFSNTALIATIVLSFFAASAFTKIWKSKWENPTLKYIVLMCVLIAVISSYFIFSNQLVLAQPTVPTIDAYSFISQNTPINSVIFASKNQGAQIAYFSQRKIVNVGNTKYQIYSNRSLETEKILYSKSLTQTLKNLKELGATHILVDPQLLSGDNWREDKGGLPLLLRNKKAFTIIYSGDYLLYQINYEELVNLY